MAKHTANFEMDQLRVGDSFVKKDGEIDTENIVLDRGYASVNKKVNGGIVVTKHNPMVWVYLTKEEIIALYNNFVKG
jgi:hypothetical protein